MEAVFLTLFLVAILSCVAVAVWAVQRRKERESLYYHDTIRKIAELHGAQAVLDYMRETHELKGRRIGNGLILGGCLAIFAGAALTFFLWAAVFVPSGGRGYIHFVGLIPVLVGIGLLFYAMVLTKRKNAP
jgi:hypothetical protein